MIDKRNRFALRNSSSINLKLWTVRIIIYSEKLSHSWTDRQLTTGNSSSCVVRNYILLYRRRGKKEAIFDNYTSKMYTKKKKVSLCSAAGQIVESLKNYIFCYTAMIYYFCLKYTNKLLYISSAHRKITTSKEGCVSYK